MKRPLQRCVEQALSGPPNSVVRASDTPSVIVHGIPLNAFAAAAVL